MEKNTNIAVGSAPVSEYVTLQLKGKSWTFRALDLDQIEQLAPHFEAINKESAPEHAGQGQLFGLSIEFRDAVAEIAAASLQDQHSGTSVTQVRKLITLATLQSVMEAIRGVSGLNATTEGVQGEA